MTVINDWRGQGVTMFWGHGDSPPTQIDANCGITAAVLEMLCYSRPGFISVLPGLPSAWTRGSARGIRCKGGVTVDLDWDFGSNATRIRLETAEEQTVSLRLPDYLSAEPGGLDEPQDPSARPTLRLQPGVPRTVSAKLKQPWLAPIPGSGDLKGRLLRPRSTTSVSSPLGVGFARSRRTN